MAEIASANILDPTAKKRGEVMRWHTVPWAVFSIPEAAGVGLTESAAKREGRDVLVAKGSRPHARPLYRGERLQGPGSEDPR